LGPMAWIIIEETKKMAIRFSPVGEINLHGKNLALSQSVRKMNFSSRKLAENQADSWQLAVERTKSKGARRRVKKCFLTRITQMAGACMFRFVP
jgi:hypothetical protein